MHFICEVLAQFIQRWIPHERDPFRRACSLTKQPSCFHACRREAMEGWRASRPPKELAEYRRLTGWQPGRATRRETGRLIRPLGRETWEGEGDRRDPPTWALAATGGLRATVSGTARAEARHAARVWPANGIMAVPPVK